MTENAAPPELSSANASTNSTEKFFTALKFPQQVSWSNGFS